MVLRWTWLWGSYPKRTGSGSCCIRRKHGSTQFWWNLILFFFVKLSKPLVIWLEDSKRDVRKTILDLKDCWTDWKIELNTVRTIFKEAERRSEDSWKMIGRLRMISIGGKWVNKFTKIEWKALITMEIIFPSVDERWLEDG